MRCEEVRKKWEGYKNGQCLVGEEKEIEEHLQSCIHCEKLLNEELEQQEKLSFKETEKGHFYDELTVKKQQKIIRKAKWKSRIMNTFTVFGVLLIVSFISMFLTGLYYIVGGENSKVNTSRLVLKTVTQMTMPNVYIDGFGSSTNVFFTMDMKGYLQKDIGNEQKAIGKIHGKMFFNRLNVKREWTDGQYNVRLYFMHPEVVRKQPATEKQYFKESMNETWNALELLPEGTVSEVALSFNELYSMDEVYQLLKDVDLNIAWHAIDTGTEVNREHSLYLGTINGIWGIHESSWFDLSKKDMNQIEEYGEGERKGEIFKQSLQFLKDHRKLAKKYEWDIERHGTFEEMIAYVDENGVKAYGVVVTGPTKELLKLAEYEQISYATLGEVDFWNWYTSPASGTMY